MKNQTEKNNTAEADIATLKFTLKSKSGFTATGTATITAEQWGLINRIIDSKKDANLTAAAPFMYDFLKKHEAWEARLIECDEAWEGRNFAITDELYEEFHELQILRNEILAKAEGRAEL